MKSDNKESKPNYDLMETTSKILSRHGKNDEEIKEFLEEQFPISSAIIDKIIESRQKKKK